MSITSKLFRAARLSADASAASSGKAKRIARRGKNKTLGKGLAKAGFWSRLWK